MDMAKGHTKEQRDAFAARLVSIMARRQLSPADLIRRIKVKSDINVSSASVSQWMNAEHIPGPRYRGPLAASLEISEDELMGRSAIGAFALQTLDLIKPTDGGAIPVYGAAQGGAGIMLLESDPIEYTPRPGTLLNVRDAFAVYVVNDSMSPAFDPGDRCHIHPSRPPAPGQYVLLVKTDGNNNRHALIKRLIKITTKVWRVEQFNPAKQFDLPRAEWQQAFLILGSDRAV